MTYIFLAEGFEEIEALTSVDVFRRAGLEIKTVGVGGKKVKGSHGIEVLADTVAEDVFLKFEEDDMLLFPGGMPGAKNLDENEIVDVCIKSAARHGSFLGAICASPMILGKRGLLRGKKATCFPGFEQYLEGAETVSDSAVRDGRIITGKCMGASLDFALEAAACFIGKEKALEIGKSVNAEK